LFDRAEFISKINIYSIISNVYYNIFKTALIKKILCNAKFLLDMLRKTLIIRLNLIKFKKRNKFLGGTTQWKQEKLQSK